MVVGCLVFNMEGEAVWAGVESLDEGTGGLELDKLCLDLAGDTATDGAEFTK